MKSFIIFTGILIMMSCSHHINPSYSPLGGTFDLEGHRGCRGLMPENTIPAFLKAIDLGVTTLEMDAVITKDSQIAISHEPFFNHEITTKPDGGFVTEGEEKSLNIYQMTYDEVKTYDVGMKLYPGFPQQQKLHTVKPLLKDVIDSVEAYTFENHKQPVQYNIETKCTPATDNLYHPAPDRYVEMIMVVIKEKKIENRTIVQSFDIRSLQYLHRHYPVIKTSLLIDDDDKKPFALQLKNLGFIPTIYSPAYRLVTPLLVKQCHDTGIKLIPWTVNDKTEMERLKKLGVDGIITDYPNMANAK
jgi:glycerophosphoryl diester phosphodiesterase